MVVRGWGALLRTPLTYGFLAESNEWLTGVVRVDIIHVSFIHTYGRQPMYSPITVNSFLSDPRGAKFRQVVGDPRINNFQQWLDFFNDPEIQRRMMDAEIHYGRPALAGVICEMEQDRSSPFKSFLASYDGHSTAAAHRAIGVIVLMAMERNGWRKSGKSRGSLGQRISTTPGTTGPGAYRNASGLSLWFVSAQHYEPANGLPYKSVSELTRSAGFLP